MPSIGSLMEGILFTGGLRATHNEIWVCMAHWALDDIAWHEFNASKIKPDIVSLVKAAAMVEHNGHAYARYLCDVFADDPALQRDMQKKKSSMEKRSGNGRKWLIRPSILTKVSEGIA